MMTTRKKLTMAVAATAFAVCAFPAMAGAVLRSTAWSGSPINPGCWNGNSGAMINTCATTEAIYFNPVTSDYYSPNVYFAVYDPSSTSVVACVTVGEKPDLSYGYSSGYFNGVGSSYTTISITSSYNYVPSGGSMYIRCNVPQNGKVVNYSYDEN
jgi:hypothetical protein